MTETFQDLNKSKDPWRWRNFTADELSCRMSGECRMSPLFLDKLQSIRNVFGKPMTITSAYRCPDYNAHISSSGRNGPHTTGRAVDIALHGEDAHRIIKIALNYGMTGIGVAQKGTTRFIHIDDLEKPDFPRPAIWSY